MASFAVTCCSLSSLPRGHSLGGLVYFEEYAQLDGLQQFMFVFGSLITVGGIVMLPKPKRCANYVLLCMRRCGHCSVPLLHREVQRIWFNQLPPPPHTFRHKSTCGS